MIKYRCSNQYEVKNMTWLDLLQIKKASNMIFELDNERYSIHHNIRDNKVKVNEINTKGETTFTYDFDENDEIPCSMLLSDMTFISLNGVKCI